MNKIIIDENYIKSLPLTTNRIEVAWNENVFFSKYAIVSYYSTSAEHKNLAYEQLTYIIHSGFISGYQNRYGDNLKPPTNVYHRMTA